MAIEISQEEKNRIKLMIDNLVEKAKVASKQWQWQGLSIIWNLLKWQ